MPVADSSFLVDIMRREAGAIRLFEQYENADQSLSTTGITALELYKGAYCSSDRNNLEKVKKVLGLFTIIPVDEYIYEAYGRLAAGLQLNGRPLGVFDEVIAAIALCTDQEIITRDRHFRNVPGLTIVQY
jgi:hypothetical protein